MVGQKNITWNGQWKTALRAICIVVCIWIIFLLGCQPTPITNTTVLRIYDCKTGTVYVEVPAKVNSRLFFGWIHSQEKIPWNEYYHVGATHNLILDTITFPAFGAGIPEDKGRVCYIKDGLIYMEDIGQMFEELVWLNSHTATQDIMLDGASIVRGSELPHHARLRLVIEER